jgi:pimeloyl-ACP methyl ester carboxylesterase
MKQILKLDSGSIHWMQKGQGENLLYLHAEADVGIWTETMEQLSQSYRVMMPQHPGFGESPRLDWIETMEDMVFYYKDFLDAMNIESVHLMGASLGGWIAAEFAVRYPERVKSLILVSALGLQVKGQPYADVFILNEKELNALQYHNAEHIPDFSDEQLASRMKDRRMLAQLVWHPRMFNPKLEERLHRIKAPVLIVWGKEDRIAPLAVGEKYQSLIENAEIKILEECGHVPTMEKPSELASEVIRFLNQGKESNIA